MDPSSFTTGIVMFVGGLFIYAANRWKSTGKGLEVCIPRRDALPEGVKIEEIRSQWLEMMEEWADRQSDARPSLQSSDEGEERILLYFRRDSDYKSVPLELSLEKVKALSYEVIGTLKTGGLKERIDALELVSMMIFLDKEWRKETSKYWDDLELKAEFLRNEGGSWLSVEKDLCRFTQSEFEMYFKKDLNPKCYEIDGERYVVKREAILDSLNQSGSLSQQQLGPQWGPHSFTQSGLHTGPHFGSQS